VAVEKSILDAVGRSRGKEEGDGSGLDEEEEGMLGGSI
jgi:hypothetical protein